jgi:hypothetical protein
VVFFSEYKTSRRESRKRAEVGARTLAAAAGDGLVGGVWIAAVRRTCLREVGEAGRRVASLPVVDAARTEAGAAGTKATNAR